MFDYKLIEAFASVINEEGFEKGALKLNITQSAVSQRIKILEDQTGQILIVRSNPPKPTKHGKKILKHFQMVSLLENELRDEIYENKETSIKNISMGINSDSLSTWFIKALEPLLKSHEYLLDLRVDDQDETDLMLKNGEVFGCISSKKISTQGCSSAYLGQMKYRLVASPGFIKKFFKNGLNESSIQKAPCVIFNKKDKLQYQAFKKEFNKDIKNFPCHYIPSTEKFFEFIINGYGYGMVPDVQSESHLKNGELNELTKNYTDVSLYWNSWKIDSTILKKFTATLVENCNKLLK